MSLHVAQIAHSTRLQQVSFTAKAGQFVGIIGANGAGKSSLLTAITGQLMPLHQGSVHYNERSVLHMSASERRALFGYLPQSPALHGDISVSHFLQSGLVNLPAANAGRDELTRVANLLAITGFLPRPLPHLSGGEQRRIHLARALLGDQPWLVCDEPTASLDLHHQLKVMALLRSFADNGKLVTAALHDLSLAARFCDKLVLLHEGRLMACGEPAEVLSEANLARAFAIKARWLCTEQGVALLPTLLK
ncbi:ABC transporter ATP-binding protein [Pseudidiomarina insulisalsae]|uniref:Iron ABC transporter n=1 Tax=Pseudidiomarina insulisalsae TaxID=575789 RepID=A0A432Y8L6_9GAMM|nr:ATP-binding cassette domain-containing protein [Pseudidiomarina insulisalsae]RUO57328.1 iron ABC transporter [Pseudidiomarina insulisalsae]